MVHLRTRARPGHVLRQGFNFRRRQPARTTQEAQKSTRIGTFGILNDGLQAGTVGLDRFPSWTQWRFTRTAAPVSDKCAAGTRLFARQDGQRIRVVKATGLPAIIAFRRCLVDSRLFGQVVSGSCSIVGRGGFRGRWIDDGL